jgi:RimJ/RimL family protein N-acetyltransferase
MPAPDTITTKRLILRRADERDAVAIARFLNDPQISLNTYKIRYPFTGRDLRRYMGRALAPHSADELGRYLITPRHNPRLVMGGAGIHSVNGTLNLGYWIGRPFRKRGYMFEACEALVHQTFETLDCACISITCMLGNHASQRIIEKLGSRFTGRSSGRSALLRQRVPILNYVLERSAWAQRQQRNGS